MPTYVLGFGIGNMTEDGIMIVRRKKGWYVVSESGRNLGGPYATKKEAQKRLAQVEYFKRKGESFHDDMATRR